MDAGDGHPRAFWRRRRGVCMRDPRSGGGGALEKSKDQSLGKESKGVCGFLGVLER